MYGGEWLTKLGPRTEWPMKRATLSGATSQEGERCAGDSVKAKSELWRDWVPARRWDDGLLLWRCAVAAVRRDETWAPD